MKNQLFATVSALGLWLIVVLGVNYVISEFFDINKLSHNIIYLSIFAGILSGLTYLTISNTNKISVLLVFLVIVSVIWLFAFPTPAWRNPLLWNWPIVGFFCIFFVVTVGTKINVFCV